jgi:putative ABC transport system permease protein
VSELAAGKQTFEDKLAAASDSFYNHDVDQDGNEDGGYNGAAAQLAQASAALQKARADYSSGMSAYQSGLATWRSGIDSYYANLATWRDSQATLMEKYGEYAVGKPQLAEAEQTLADKWNEYNDGLTTYNDALPDAQQKIGDGESDLADARARLAKLSMPNYEAGTRREALGSEAYKTYDTVSEIIDSLAGVFPVLLYVVAAFVTLSTMTRMVDEERINSGTLKALGYHDRDVALKFVLYGALAGGIGTVLGIILGHTLLPWIVYSAYGPKFTLPPIHLGFYPVITVVAILLAGLCAVLPAVLAVRHELGEKPAALLLPKPPKGGSKIMLEHIRPVWSRMSFTHKVTARNLFRYKQRMFMTVLGVAGAVCALVAGFGVQHSIQEMSQKQFGSILKYDMIAVQAPTATDDQVADLNDRLAGDDISSQVPIHYESVTLTAGANNDTQEISMIVPEDDSQLDDYLDLHNRKTEQKLELGSDGCVISERLASLLGIGVGDQITFNDSDGVQRTTTVTGVCEMYMGHFIVIMYNLTNLNVGERMRELSTIKVLGFHSNETTMYIYRETILLTALGLLFGYVLGVGMHEYILNVVPPDNVMFNPGLAAIELIVPAIVIAAITLVLYFVELRRLSTVDMLEALKSVE